MLVDRLNMISALLNERGSLRVDEITQELQVSPATARRYLVRLAREGALVRTYGGCIPRGPVPDALATEPASREARAKRAIGVEAAQLIQDGETVIVSSGTTTVEVARQLVVSGKQVTVITNALDVAILLMDVPDIALMVLGGTVRPQMHSLLGDLTELGAKHVRADRLVMGIPAVHIDQGLTSDHLPEVITDRTLIGAAREVTVVADASKFGRVKPAFLLALDEVTTIVTDEGLSDDDAQALQRRGPTVVRANVPNQPEDERGM